jgi:hypothetical protein
MWFLVDVMILPMILETGLLSGAPLFVIGIITYVG